MYRDSEGRLWFRQSWLKDFLDCPERARRKAVEADRPRRTSDSALIGTSVHTAIQAVLEGRAEPDAIEDETNNAVIEMMTTEEIQFTKFNAGDLPGHAARCARAWADVILPKVKVGGRCEHNFSIIVDEIDGVEIGLTGTVDYISPDHDSLWDWKTATRKYSQSQYQKSSIQASTYATALSLQNEVPLPVEFNFGVMIRGEKNANAQVVAIQRTDQHRDWFLKRLRDTARFVLRAGVDESWPTNEESFLCSATWCEFYDTCRGAFIPKELDDFQI
jgi:CRISPR/Cas system-associated exonuclease Cas4 (RecB family)